MPEKSAETDETPLTKQLNPKLGFELAVSWKKPHTLPISQDFCAFEMP
jgi:hypothetical protein